MMVDLVLFQPDIPGNTGTLLRLGACMGVTLHIIEPAGFRLDDKALKRAGMDYLETAAMTRHTSWESFNAWRIAAKRRLILLSTRASHDYLDFSYRPGDLLIFGRESSGVPDYVHAAADSVLTITMHNNARSLNVSAAAAMVIGEALRQTGGPVKI